MMEVGKRTFLGVVRPFCQAGLAPLLADPQLDFEVADRGSGRQEIPFFLTYKHFPQLPPPTKYALCSVLLEGSIPSGPAQL